MSKMTIVYPSYWDGNTNHYGDIEANRFTLSEPVVTLCGIATKKLSKHPADPSPLHWYDCAVCKSRTVQIAATPAADRGTP